MRIADRAERKIGAAKQVCRASLFTALNIMANSLTFYVSPGGANAAGFSYAVCFLAGATSGPLIGFVVGLCGDALGWAINPSGGAFNPAVAFVSGLIGAIPGAVFSRLKNDDKTLSVVLATILSYFLIFVVCTNLNTVFLYFYFMRAKYSFPAYFVVRTSRQIVVLLMNLAVSLALCRPVRKMVKA